MHAPGRPLGQRIACEAWRVTKLVYEAIRAALVFVPLHEIPAALGAFLEHLARSNEKTRPKQIELFQRELRPTPPDAHGLSPPPSPVDTSGPPTTPQVRAPGRPLGQRIACEAWRVTKFVYEAIRAALVFVPLPEIPTDLRAFLEYIGRSNEKTKPKQIDLFQRELRPAAG